MLRKLTILTTVLLLALFVGNASARTFVVDADGDPEVEFLDLETALNTAATWPGDGHIIEIMPGEYSDHSLTCPPAGKVVEIIAVEESRNGVVFTDPGYQTNDFMDLSGTVGLTISGFTVMDYIYAFTGVGIDDLIMTDMVLENNGVDGFVSHPPDSDGGGVELKDCDDGWFENLEIFNGERGWRLKDDAGDHSDGNTITGCTIYDNEQYGIGIGWNGGSNNTIDGNTVSGSEDFGIQIRGAAGTGNDIIGNTVFDCIWEGITVSNCTNSTVSGNEVYDCAYQVTNPSGSNDWPGLKYAGINFEYSAAGSITDNICYNNGDGSNGYGIYVDGGYCDVSGNCLYGHADAAQAYDNSGGNYWHDNYYGAYVSVPHMLDDADGSVIPFDANNRKDYSPKLFDNSAYADPTTWEIYPDLNDEYVVEFKWAIPDCDPWEETFLAYYNFQVNFDDAMIEYVDGTAEYDETAFGPMDGSTGALYAPIGYGTGTITFAAGNDAAPFAGDFVMARATFRGIDVGPTSITISSTYLDENEVELTVGNTPLDLEIEDTQAPEMVSVTGPAVVTDDMATCYDDGEVPRVKLMIEAQAIDNFDLRRIRYNIDGGSPTTLIGGLGGTSDGTTVPVLVLTTAFGEGAHTLNVWAQDQEDNVSAEFAFPFEIDRTGPVLDDFTASDADGCAPTPGWTNEADITATLTNSDMTAAWRQMSHGGGWQSVIAYSPTGGADDFTFTLPATGTYTCYARLFDAVGNCNIDLTDNMIYDDVAPAPTGLTLDGGAAKTKDLFVDVVVGYWGGNGIIELNISEDPADFDCPASKGTGWLPLTQPVSFELTGGEVEKTVYWVGRDDAGNVTDPPLEATITFDETAPEMASLTLDDCINDYYLPEVTITWTDSWTGDDVEKAYFTINGYSDAAYEFTITAPPGTYTETFTFPYFLAIHIEEDDVNVISGYLEDDIGNAGDPIADVEFFFDETDPTIATITMSEASARTDPPKHPDHSGTADVDVLCTGLADDIIEFHVSETDAWGGEEVVYTAAGPYTGGEYTFTHTYGTAGGTLDQCQNEYLYVKVFDCSDRSGGSVSDWIWFDFEDPYDVNMTVTSSDPTNNLDIDLAITATDDCVWWKMNIYESGGVGTAETGWIDDAPTYTYTLDAGDGTREIMVEVADASGHTASFGPVSVVVDQTPPTGTATLSQKVNPHVMPGYTNSQSGNQVCMDSYSGDATKILFWEGGGSSQWMDPITACADLFTFVGPEGTITVYMRLYDGAGNYSGNIPLTIIYDCTAPAAPAALSVTGTPGGSCMLEIDPAVTGANKYYARFNYSTQYPAYDDWVDLDAKPPFPDLGSGNGEFFFAEGETTYDFEGPQMDIYSFSIWSYDMAGNISCSYNTDVTSTNYILSDLENDGVINFGADLGALSSSYDQAPGDPGDFYNAECDYGPTVDELPKPDDYVGFDELVIAVSNYAVFGDWITKRSIDDNPVPLKLTPELIVSTEMPSRLSTGDVCTISLNCNNPGAIAAFHMILGFDKDKIQVTNIACGEMFDIEEKKFFYDKIKGGELWLDGAIFGGEAQFANNEIVQISFEAKADIEQFNLEDIVMDIRNIEGEELSVTFQIKKTIENVIPSEFALRQNYPNPFNPSTTIEMALPVASNWTIAIYNIVGQKVSEFSGYNEAGIHNVVWNATRQASGIYFYKINMGDFKATKKMVLLK